MITIISLASVLIRLVRDASLLVIMYLAYLAYQGNYMPLVFWIMAGAVFQYVLTRTRIEQQVKARDQALAKLMQAFQGSSSIEDTTEDPKFFQ